MGSVRILIADDHAAMRRAIRSLLETRAHWHVCGEAGDGREAVEMAIRLQPDVVLLDVTMPKLNGFEAARRIRQEVPAAYVLVLTLHESDVLAEEARRAGADGVVFKSDAHRSLIRAIDDLLARRRTIRLADSVIEGGRHIGAFFSSEEDRYRVLAPFIEEGLARGEKALHLIDPPSRQSHRRQLRKAGIDVDRAEAQRQLQLVSWDEAYLREGGFDQQAMLTLLPQLLDDGTARGFPLTRSITHMEWAMQDRPGVGDLIEYEARLNDVLAGNHDVVICAYDLTKFPGHLIVDALRVHPAVLIGGSLRDNPFYVLPERMLEELRKKGARPESLA